jgi:hypothetical protein
LFSLWNGAVSARDAAAEIDRILPREAPAGLYQALLTGERARTRPQDVLVLTGALLCRGGQAAEALPEIFRDQGLAGLLCRGLQILLCNESRKTELAIVWHDAGWVNEYAWFSQFAGMAHDMQYRELVRIAEMLYAVMPEVVWALALRDQNDLLLMNWEEITWGSGDAVRDRAKALLLQTSTRRQTLAFWWLVRPLQAHGADREAAGKMLLQELQDVPDEVLTPLLVEYLLAEPACPQVFLDYLRKPGRYAPVKQTLTRAGMLAHFRAAARAAVLVERLPAARQRSCWRLLLDRAERLVEGGAAWSGDCEAFLSRLPEDVLRAFQARMTAFLGMLHIAPIDRIVRFKLYNHDQTLARTAQQILDYGESGADGQ